MFAVPKFSVLPLLLLGGVLFHGTGCDTVCLSCGDDDDDTSSDDDDSAGSLDFRSGEGHTWGDEWTPRPGRERSCSPVRVFHPGEDATSVAIAGEWNDWQPAAMDGPDEGGWWRLELPEIAPGEYGYKYLIDGVWEGSPPASAWAKWVDGTENRALRVGDCTVALLVHHETLRPAPDSIEVVFEVTEGLQGSKLSVDNLQAHFGTSPAAVEWDASQGLLRLRGDDLAAGKHSLRVDAWDESGRPLEGSPLWLPLWVDSTPTGAPDFAWDEALLYLAFVDRFRNGDHDANPPLFEPVPEVAWSANYQGGDLLGVLHAMEEDYFEQLGVDVLWLSPILENPDEAYLANDGVNNFSGFHGYWTTDPFGIEQRFGDVEADSEQRLRELIEEAHHRGIRVMFDLVLNHVHQDHVYIDERPDWFGEGCVCGEPGCSWDERRLDCWFTSYLPDLNYRNHELLQRVLADSIELIREFDIDGLRIDAAKHMDHVVMRRLSRELREQVTDRGGAPIVLLGETFTGADGHSEILEYVSEYELDGQFDFPLMWPLRDVFAYGLPFTGLAGAIETGEQLWGDALVSPFAGNHDVPRISTLLAGNDEGAWGNSIDLLAEGGSTLTQDNMVRRLAMAQAFTFTARGAPLLYYGDEIGLAGSGDPDNRRMMNFAPFLSANQQALLDRVRDIGQARARHRALRAGHPSVLWVDDDLLVLGLLTEEAERAVVALNKSGESRSVSVEVGSWGLPDGMLTGAIDAGRSAQVSGGSVTLDIGPLDYVFMMP